MDAPSRAPPLRRPPRLRRPGRPHRRRRGGACAGSQRWSAATSSAPRPGRGAGGWPSGGWTATPPCSRPAPAGPAATRATSCGSWPSTSTAWTPASGSSSCGSRRLRSSPWVPSRRGWPTGTTQDGLARARRPAGRPARAGPGRAPPARRQPLARAGGAAGAGRNAAGAAPLARPAAAAPAPALAPAARGGARPRARRAARPARDRPLPPARPPGRRGPSASCPSGGEGQGGLRPRDYYRVEVEDGRRLLGLPRGRLRRARAAHAGGCTGCSCERAPAAAYAELQVTTTSPSCAAPRIPRSWSARRRRWAWQALGVTDRNSLAGVVPRRTQKAQEARACASSSAAGSTSPTAPSLLCWPTDRPAYGRLSRLLTLGKRRAAKGECALTLRRRLAHAEGQLVALVPPSEPDGRLRRAPCASSRQPLAGRSGSRLSHRYRGDDAARLARLAELAPRARRAAGRHQRRALPRPRAAAAAGRADLHPRGCTIARGRLPAVRQRRAAPEVAGRDGAPVRAPSRRRVERIARDRRALPLLARRAAPTNTRPSRLAGRTPQRGAGAAAPGTARRWRYPEGICRRRSRRRSAHELELIAELRLRALLPDRPRHRRASPAARASSARAAARRPTRRSATAWASPRSIPTTIGPAVRALRLGRARRAARHRRRLRARAARGGDPVHLRELRPRPRRLAATVIRYRAARRHPRGRQGAGPDRRTCTDALARPSGAGATRASRERRMREAGLDPTTAPRPPTLAARARAARLPAPPVAARRRLRHDQAPAATRSCRSRTRPWRTAPSSSGTRTTSTRSAC